VPSLRASMAPRAPVFDLGPSPAEFEPRMARMATDKKGGIELRILSVQIRVISG